MQVRLLYFDGCPHWKLAEERLRQSIAASAKDPLEIELVRVGTAEEAERLKFRGSPTILFDDEDPFDSYEPIGFTCRLYRTDAGREGSPSVAQLTGAIRQRVTSS